MATEIVLDDNTLPIPDNEEENLENKEEELEPLVGKLERPFFEMERLESSNYLVETKRTEHCCSFVYTWIFFAGAGISLYFLIARNESLGLLGAIIPSFCFAFCYCVAYDIRKDPEFKEENWKTLDEALDIIEAGVKSAPYFHMEMKRKYEYRNDQTVPRTVSVDQNIDSWLDYSTPVKFLTERTRILKLNIRKFYRIDGNYTTFTQNLSNFEQQARQNNVNHENIKGSKYEVQDLPDVIMVNPKSPGRISIPWYYNRTCYLATQLFCCASYLWKRFVSSCCTEQLVYTSLKVFRDDDDKRVAQEDIDKLKEEWLEEI